MPVAYEMWQWPSLPSGTIPTQIICDDKPPNSNKTWHRLYNGQDPGGIFQPPAVLGPDGAVTGRRTLMLTAVGYPYARQDTKRILDSNLADKFHDGSGLLPDEVIRGVSWTWRNYPKGYLAVRSTVTKTFGPKYY